MNVPSYEFLSAPLWLVTLLHLVTLTLHLAAMGMLFGSLGVLLLGMPGKRWESPAARRLVRLFPTLMALTVTLGVAPLLFAQLVYHRPIYAAAIVSAWFWLAVPAAVIVAYYLLYAAAWSDSERAGWKLAVAFVGLLFVSLVLSSVFTLAERPEVLAAAWASDAGGTALHPELGRWLPRWLHLVAGALTLGAFTVTAFGRDDERLFAAGRRAYLWAMVSAVLLGVGALAGLGEHLVAYMRSTAVWWTVGALLASLGSLHFLFRRRLAAAGALLGVSLFAMVVQRHLARQVVLGEAFDPGTLTIAPQWGVFVLFLVCFVAMLGVVGWMLRLFLVRTEGSASA